VKATRISRKFYAIGTHERDIGLMSDTQGATRAELMDALKDELIRDGLVGEAVPLSIFEVIHHEDITASVETTLKVTQA
jgi:hypothetical protein